MNPAENRDTRIAVRGAFAGAALFVALIVAFSAAGPGPLPTTSLLLIGVFGVASHVVLFPVVAQLPAPSWARAAGYAWIAIDVMLNIAAVNGGDIKLISALRLGGHIPAGLWMAAAALEAAGATRYVGTLLGALLIVHAFASPWIPMWIIFIPFVMIPLWLALVGGRCFAAPVRT
ncbi:MAG TPA: hypothetical protein VLV78_18070 [Thermoanaerobaculia bacterium]|nr:hypothetical protein [Thermoanaerobaculia bacterium]